MELDFTSDRLCTLSFAHMRILNCYLGWPYGGLLTSYLDYRKPIGSIPFVGSYRLPSSFVAV